MQTTLQDKLSECDIEATLASLDDQSANQVLAICQDVKDLAAACKALLAKDVHVCLRLRAVLGYELTTMVTKELAPFLHSVDYHRALQLSGELNKSSDFFLKPAACFCQAAFNNLSSNNSPIQSLCLSDRSMHELEPSKGVSLENSIAAIASLHHLTKLHLTILARTDFEPLAQLKGLQDLALQSDSRAASATDVLRSNSQTLHTVKLVSRGWNADTLTTLLDLPKLQTFTIKVLSLCVDDAQTLSRLLRPSSVQLMLRKCAKMKPEAFKILTSGQATITHLELWELEPACFCALQTMPSLQALTVARPSASFTGEGLAQQPALSTLRLVSCFTLSNDGLHGLITSTPILRMLLIQQELQHACPAEFREQETLTKHGLVSIVAASQLEIADFRGVKVTRGGEKLLESSIIAQQKAGKMLPAVVLMLPKFSKRLGDHVFSPDSLHYPSFVPRLEGRTNTVICGSVNKDPNLKEMISSMQALASS